ncbi:MAG: methylenetetrahydrofolate reductase [NAD(P)H] [Azoarcus sp.]|jgi:methylenetetrahydrofolate reductase (NADPH)|nr:methylenetetrahydrofolate reductase [NAD(P)H] [Azoarcus sp.]
MTTALSIELFPPQTGEGLAKLRTEREKLAALEPVFFSVTYGAGGSTRERTSAIVKEIMAANFDAAPHLSCIGSTRAGIRESLAEFRAAGIRRIVALRGDLPSGMVDPGEFRYANELVEFIRAETGDAFQIIVAAYPEWHPQAKSPETDLQNFARKVQAGANAAITQYFYNADAYFYFVERVRALSVDIPIIPGIMPIVNFSRLARFSDACGADIPRWMRKTFESHGDDAASIRAFGVDVVTRLCEKLLHGGAPGLHFYSMNTAALTVDIWQRLAGAAK